MLLNHYTHKTRTGGGFRTHRSRARCLNAVELHEQQQRTDTHIRTHRRNIRPTAGAQQRRRLRRDRGEPSRRACDRIAPAAASPDGLAAAQRTAGWPYHRRHRRSTLASPAARTRPGAPFRSPERPATAHAAVSSSFRRMMTGLRRAKEGAKGSRGGEGMRTLAACCARSRSMDTNELCRIISTNMDSPSARPARLHVDVKCAPPATWVRTCG